MKRTLLYFLLITLLTSGINCGSGNKSEPSTRSGYTITVHKDAGSYDIFGGIDGIDSQSDSILINCKSALNCLGANFRDSCAMVIKFYYYASANSDSSWPVFRINVGNNPWTFTFLSCHVIGSDSLIIPIPAGMTEDSVTFFLTSGDNLSNVRINQITFDTTTLPTGYSMGVFRTDTFPVYDSPYDKIVRYTDYSTSSGKEVLNCMQADFRDSCNMTVSFNYRTTQTTPYGPPNFGVNLAGNEFKFNFPTAGIDGNDTLTVLVPQGFNVNDLYFFIWAGQQGAAVKIYNITFSSSI